MKESILKECRLPVLNIGDSVIIEHAHRYEHGCWSSYIPSTYVYKGFDEGKFHFQHSVYNHETLALTKENDGPNRLKGVLTNHKH